MVIDFLLDTVEQTQYFESFSMSLLPIFFKAINDFYSNIALFAKIISKLTVINKTMLTFCFTKSHHYE